MIYVFGAAFDPITKAHLAIIEQVTKLKHKDDQFYVMISNNDEKDYPTSLDDRFEVVRNTLQAKFKDNKPTIIEQDRRTYLFLQDTFDNTQQITIVVGEDEWDALVKGKWHHHEKLLAKYQFIVFTRYGASTVSDSRAMAHNLDNVTVREIDFPDISSSKVRDILSRNPSCLYKDVQEYITRPTFESIVENELYYQNGFNYKKDEAEFIKRYQTLKVEKGWAEPSVTVDILAHHDNKVLLIRRGNFPYKGYWCLPGGFFNGKQTEEADGTIAPPDADLDYAAAREFREETCIDINHAKFEQIKTYAHVFDPRLRVVDVAFSVRVSAKDAKKAAGSDDAVDARWFDLDDLPEMGFHHKQIIDDWLKSKNN